MDLIVDIADFQVANDTAVDLVTYSLGSCIGVTIWDPVLRVGGMLHYMLPLSSIAIEKARINPAMFADTGIPQLFRKAYELGAVKQRLVVKIAGGASLLGDNGTFSIGKRNYAVLRQIFLKNGIQIVSEHVGGMISRTMRLQLATGRVTIRNRGQEIEL